MKHIKLYEDFLNEEATTSWSKMMKGVRAGGSGPWSIVAIQDKKVVGQSIDIKTPDLIPAKYEALKREYPKAKLHIEDGGGMVVWNGPLNEGSVSWNPGKPKMARTVYDEEGFFNYGSGRDRREIRIAGETKSGKFISFNGELWTKDGRTWSYYDNDNWSSDDRADIKAVLTAWLGKIDAIAAEKPYMKNRKNSILIGLNEGVSMDAVYIHQITGCGQNAAQDFIDDNGIDGAKLAAYVKQHRNGKEKYDVRDIIAGTGVGTIKGFRERFIEEMKYGSKVNEYGRPYFFTEDQTVIKDPKAYSAADLKKTANELKSRELDVKSDAKSITVIHKEDDHVMTFDYSGGEWTGTFEDGEFPSSDSAAMDIIEFESEVEGWLNWYRNNRD